MGATNGNGQKWQWALIADEENYVLFSPKVSLNGEVQTDISGRPIFPTMKEAISLERSKKIAIFREDCFPKRIPSIHDAIKLCWENSPPEETLPLQQWLVAVETRNTRNPRVPQCLAFAVLLPPEGFRFERDGFGRLCLAVDDAERLSADGFIQVQQTKDNKPGIMSFDEAMRTCFERNNGTGARL